MNSLFFQFICLLINPWIISIGYAYPTFSFSNYDINISYKYNLLVVLYYLNIAMPFYIIFIL